MVVLWQICKRNLVGIAVCFSGDLFLIYCFMYGRSYGFFRRQIVLTVKEREPDRKDDPFLGEKLIAEAEGIFLWCLGGCTA